MIAKTVVGEVGQLPACNRPLVFQLSISTLTTTRQRISACNVWANNFRRIAAPYYVASVAETEEVVPHIGWTPAKSASDTGGRVAAQSFRHLRTYLEFGYRAEERSILFATMGDTTVGVYVGARSLRLHTFHHAASRWSNGSCVDTTPYAEDYLFNSTIIDIVKPAIPPTRLPNNNSTGDSTIAARSSRFLHARADCRAIQVDSGNTCATLLTRCGNGLTAADSHKYNPSSSLCSTLTVGQMICCTSGDLPSAPEPEGNADGTCRMETVDDGDDCGKLVTRIGNGLTAAQLYKYNDDTKLCSTLVPGQRVCCTTGKLPDIRPKQKRDGSCAAYQIKYGDSCSKIAFFNGVTIDELKSFNKDTWGYGNMSPPKRPHFS
ncbi:Killer toxin subunits alpha/beta 5 [Colletotrichum truncatum]|uniref:Killer toxin subunits alpha/beta 5 n=1 Tax=Colletotrichum truncatum TaxID=5467 RepID=A0ACC3ZB04_COLTU